MKKRRLFIPLILSAALLCAGLSACGNTSHKDKEEAAKAVDTYIKDKYSLSFSPDKWVIPADSDEMTVVGRIEGLSESFSLIVEYDEAAGDYVIIDDARLCAAFTQKYLQPWIDSDCKSKVSFEDCRLFGQIRYEHSSKGQKVCMTMEEFEKSCNDGTIDSFDAEFYILMSSSSFTSEEDAKEKTKQFDEYISGKFKNCKYNIILYVLSDELYKTLCEANYKDYNEMENANYLNRAEQGFMLYTNRT